jgi:hypothetical protein
MAVVGPNEQHPEQPPDLAGLTGEMRAEWRAEQADAAADAAEQWRHGRRLADWLTERMHAGDRIAVTIEGARFSGLVAEIGPDLIGLQCVFGRVDVHLIEGASVFIEINDKAHSGGARATSSRTFREAMYARDGAPDVTVGTLHDAEGLDGALFVGHDFVSVVARLGAETVVPMHSVTWVSVRR